MRIASNAVANAKAEAAADAGLNIAAYMLIANAGNGTGSPRPSLDLPAEGGCRLHNGYEIRWAIENAAGRIDVNFAPQGLLAALFEGAGASRAEAARLVAAIEDYRDPDDDRRLDGAERQAYARAGLAHGPKNAPFESTLELGRVIGMRPGLLATVRPYLTIRSGQEGVDPRHASRGLIDMLGGEVPRAFRVAAVTGTYILTSSATGKDGAAARVEATVTLRTVRPSQAASAPASRSPRLQNAALPSAERNDVFVWDWTRLAADEPLPAFENIGNATGNDC